MAVVPTQLLEPVGLLSPALFAAGAEPAAVLAAYLADADERLAAAGVSDGAARDRFARAWAYHRTYAAAVDRMSAAPLSGSLADEGSVTRSVEQLRVLRERAARYEAEALALLPPSETPSVRRRVGTVSVRHEVVW